MKVCVSIKVDWYLADQRGRKVSSDSRCESILIIARKSLRVRKREKYLCVTGFGVIQRCEHIKIHLQQHTQITQAKQGDQ